jgi:hypothetical protein
MYKMEKRIKNIKDLKNIIYRENNKFKKLKNKYKKL